MQTWEKLIISNSAASRPVIKKHPDGSLTEKSDRMLLIRYDTKLSYTLMEVQVRP